MKHNLGKLVLLLSFVFIQAEDFTHTFSVDKIEPYVKEAVILTFTLKQTNPNIVLMFDFDLVKSENYTFQRLDTQETDNHPTKGLHAVQVKYVYLVYPMHSGKVALDFKLLKKVTTDDSVAYSFSGDRDNVKGLITKDYKMTLAPLTLHVKALPKGTQVVGDFTLNYKIPQHKADSFEPLPFQVTLKGLGYPPLLDLLPKDVNFTVFTEKPLVDSRASLQGTHSTVHYPMAFSHAKSFTLDGIHLKAFNPKTQKSYELRIPKQNFDITTVDKNTLIDNIDNPKVLKADWSWIYTLLTYLLIFVAGFFTALSWKWTKKIKTKEVNPVEEKIQNCKDSKTLLQVLLAQDSHRFSAVIATLENSLYGNGKINLSKMKKEAIKKEAMDNL